MPSRLAPGLAISGCTTMRWQTRYRPCRLGPPAIHAYFVSPTLLRGGASETPAARRVDSSACNRAARHLPVNRERAVAQVAIVMERPPACSMKATGVTIVEKVIKQCRTVSGFTGAGNILQHTCHVCCHLPLGPCSRLPRSAGHRRDYIAAPLEHGHKKPGVTRHECSPASQRHCAPPCCRSIRTGSSERTGHSSGPRLTVA